jgi:hypothetical protein
VKKLLPLTEESLLPRLWVRKDDGALDDPVKFNWPQTPLNMDRDGSNKGRMIFKLTKEWMK